MKGIKEEKERKKKKVELEKLEEWKVCFNSFIPEKEKLRETLCTLANGYIGLRSSIPYASNKISYKGFYCSGLYNKLKTRIKGKNFVVENEDLVNLPDWTFFKFGFEKNKVLDIDKIEIIDYNQELDIKSGKLKRKVKFRDKSGRETTIEEERVVSMADKHLAALRIKIVPENWEGKLYVKSGIDGSVRNSGVERYRKLANKHLKVLEKGKRRNKIYLISQTTESKILIVDALRQLVYGKAKRLVKEEKEKIYEMITASISRDNPFILEKHLSFFTSRDMAISDPLLDAFEKLNNSVSFDEIFEKSKKVWESLWDIANIKIKTKGLRQQQILRFNLFHLLQVVSKFLAENDAGIPARGLHGEAYRGHVFWDEIFILPIVCLHFPDLAREVLKYRYRRLDAARENARKQGFKGALFPWQSASEGREVSQQWHLNPLSGRWLKDNTYLQRHVNLAIAYNFWNYFEITHDYNFLYNYGAEVIFEIARGMASLCSYNKKKKKWEIRRVMGPDEYHDAYPGKKPGINNNAYTNLMTVWLFSTATELISIMPKLELEKIRKKISLNEGEAILWKKIMKDMFIPFIPSLNKVIAQFEGYEKLKEFEFEAYRLKYGDIRRLDRILESEHDSTNNYKVSKQADALMLFYLFSTEQLAKLFKITGYKFSPKMIPETINYYLERTSHGSSLSFVAHSWVLSRLNREGSFEFFTKALEVDFNDISKTTHEGVHLGAMAGSVDIIQRCYTGLEFRKNIVFLNPLFPKELERIRMKIYYRGGWINLDIGKKRTSISFDAPKHMRVEINFKGKRILLKGNSKVSISY